MASSALPENNQMNFNPSWMRSASAAVNTSIASGKPNMSRVDAPALNAVQDYPLSEPIFVKNRYGREDLLALLPKESTVPEGLDQCKFFVKVAQQPIVLTSLTDAETRLQHNINSSKAMSALSHIDRALITSGNLTGQSNLNSSLGSTGSASQSSWAGGSGVGRGGGQSVRGFGAFRGRGGQTVSSATHAGSASDSTGSARYVAARGRGSTALGRGGSTAVFNTRAQGLYDPRDPRDRPRARVRSISDDSASPLTSVTGAGGLGQGSEDSSTWSQATGRGSWRRYAANGKNLHQHGSVDSSSINRASMPEWLDEEQEKGPGMVSARSGSFDENGQFRTCEFGSLKETNNSNSGSILKKLAGVNEKQKTEKQMGTQASSHLTDSISISNPWTVIAETSESRLDIGEQLAQQTQMNLLLSSAPVASRASADLFDSKIPEEVQIPQRPLVANVSPAVVDDKWYYVDPRDVVQGPFPTAHMEAWFKCGYFAMDLNVRKGSDPNARFQTLGELIQLNGATTPFRTKPVEPTPVVPVHLPLQPQACDMSTTPWPDDINTSLLKAAKVEEQRQKLEEEQRRVAEKEKELKEMQENLRRQEEERLMKVRQLELELQKQQEELARRAAEEQQRAAAREREIEAEKKRIAEEIEKTKREEIEKALAEERKREEEERIAREKEIERIKAEAERLRLENEEAARKAAEKAKEETRKRALLEEQKKKEMAEKERERARQAAAVVAEAKKQAADGRFDITESYAPVSKPKNNQISAQSGGAKMWQASYRTGDEKLIAPKALPWQSTPEDAFSVAGKTEKGLLEIQQEEERQMLAERKQKQESGGFGRGTAASHAAGGGIWAASSQKLTWNQHSQLNTQTSQSPQSVAWGGAGLVHDTHHTVNIFFDGPSLESSNKQAKKSASSPVKSMKASNKAAWQSGAKQENSRLEQEAVKKLFKQPVLSSSDGFTNWVVQRVKQLNAQVDADVLAEFIENVDSPDEVEDYIIGYLGDSTQVKEFVREFLAKRGDVRSKKRAPIKDDLSGPAPAADPSLSSSNVGFGGNGNGQQHSTAAGKKKKKNKGSRLIVDGACLGFKGAADPNRVNIGEIDSVTAAEVGRK